MSTGGHLVDGDIALDGAPPPSPAPAVSGSNRKYIIVLAVLLFVVTSVDFSVMAQASGWKISSNDLTRPVTPPAFTPSAPTPSSPPISAPTPSAPKILPFNSIAFMGDSLTRYQYLSLAYFVTHDTWIDPRTKPNLVVEKDYASWKAFYNATNTAYAGFERCDCYRSQKWDKAAKTVTENRYYVAPHWNLYYIQAFGSIPSKGNWNPQAVPSTQPPFELNASFMWDYDWPNTILNHVALLRPKPQWVVLNAGIWKNDFNNIEYRNRVIQATRDAGIKSIWKTTT
ncbi:hypothetical protein ScalyP_jg6298 [Parmales sp. scaly parma]|nr:hypothetical protein ScalyP_jg6298 [Parmales sp. scaly parma]